MSRSQQARRETEAWITTHGYCLACNSDKLRPTPPNTPARDFECPACNHPYELKATAKPIRDRIVDGAYRTMLARLQQNTAASFLLMRYDEAWQPIDLLTIHRSLILPQMIEARPPLSPTARRAGWVGCNILLHEVPPEGRITLIRQAEALPRNLTRQQFQKAERLATLSLPARGWATALLTRLHRFGTADFTLQQVYALEPEMRALFPNNQHIREKLRQQLQVLRDAGMLTFQAPGRYKLFP